MKRESYLSQPPAVEVYPVKNGTDIILRKNVEQVEKEESQDGEKRTYTCWECDEAQYRHKGIVTKEEVEEKFDYWFAIAEGKTEPEAADEQLISSNEPNLMERLEALENGLAELAEVICGG